MSLERKDIRLKVDADVHQALTAICEADGVDIAEFVESLIVPVVVKRVHRAHHIATRVPVLGSIRAKTGGASHK